MLLKSLLSLLLIVGTTSIHSFHSHHKSQSMDNKTFSVEVIRYTIPEDQSAAFEKAYAEAGKHL